MDKILFKDQKVGSAWVSSWDQPIIGLWHCFSLLVPFFVNSIEILCQMQPCHLEYDYITGNVDFHLEIQIKTSMIGEGI